MSDIAIRVESLSKQYNLGATIRHERLKDLLTSSLNGLFSRNTKSESRNSKSDFIWALKDVSFEVKRGEVLGIIGANGAGKSTLLKILSRITEPTSGRTEIYGRVGSLLEVGTGFDRELTGRENVFLNGAILGMKKVEIERKFDEIVAFAEIDKFIDTPVKRYSSGMYVRLAFAVAAHLDPEILIVDEVLAVGDAKFQKKCIGKMADVGKQGRTVLFVSHNMSAITRMCDRAILIEDGVLKNDGSSHKVVSGYLGSGSNTPAIREWTDPAKSPGDDIACLRAVRVKTGDGHISDVIDIRRPVSVEIEYEVLQSGYILLPSLHFQSQDGIHIFSTVDLDPRWRGRPRPKGRYISRARVPGNFWNEGIIYVSAGLGTPTILQCHEREVVCFHVTDTLETDSARGDNPRRFDGVIRPLLNWETEFNPVEVPIGDRNVR